MILPASASLNLGPDWDSFFHNMWHRHCSLCSPPYLTYTGVPAAVSPRAVPLVPWGAEGGWAVIRQHLERRPQSHVIEVLQLNGSPLVSSNSFMCQANPERSPAPRSDLKRGGPCHCLLQLPHRNWRLINRHHQIIQNNNSDNHWGK